MPLVMKIRWIAKNRLPGRKTKVGMYISIDLLKGKTTFWPENLPSNWLGHDFLKPSRKILEMGKCFRSSSAFLPPPAEKWFTSLPSNRNFTGLSIVGRRKAKLDYFIPVFMLTFFNQNITTKINITFFSCIVPTTTCCFLSMLSDQVFIC